MALPVRVTPVDRQLGDLVTGKQLLSKQAYAVCAAEGLLPILTRVTEEVADDHRRAVYAAVAAELARLEHDRAVQSAFRSAGIDVLVIKGGALAHTHYEESWHRTRSDTDLLVREVDVDVVFQVLDDLGYSKGDSLPGRVVVSEQAFHQEIGGGVLHTLDVHWRLNNAWQLSRLVSFDDLWPGRIEIPETGAHTCNPVWAVLIAALHRSAHQLDVAYEIDGLTRLQADFTLWIYDVHLLTAGFTAAEWKRICDLGIDRSLAGQLQDVLHRSQALFGTKVPGWATTRLREASKVMPARTRSRLDGWIASFMAIPGGRLKLKWLKEQLFPSAAYMRDVYGYEGWLIWGYLKRAVKGWYTGR